jgi:hypothetical protein
MYRVLLLLHPFLIRKENRSLASLKQRKPSLFQVCARMYESKGKMMMMKLTMIQVLQVYLPVDVNSITEVSPRPVSLLPQSNHMSELKLRERNKKR